MDDIVKRLREPPFGAGTSERNLMTAAAAEITRLRNELHIVEVWSARIIAGTQQDITEIARLRAENESLRAALKPFASTKADAGYDYKADDGYDYISGLPDIVIIRIEASVREIKAARAALEEK
jgi:hypothetical protein